MDRPTVELLLPESKAKVVLYSYLTIGESRVIRKFTFSSVKVKIDANGKPVTGDTDFDISFQVEAQNQVMRFLTKEAYDPTGKKVDDAVGYLLSLPSGRDADVLFAKIDELSAESTLTTDTKKN